MRSRYSVFMDGVSLNELDNRIIITEVEHFPAELRFDSYSLANRFGGNITNKQYTHTECRITFLLRVYKTDERQQVCQELVRWANGNVLEVNDRPGQMLRCICTQPPVISSVACWGDPVTVIFSGYTSPFWEEKMPAELVLQGTEETGNLFVPGNVGNPLVGVEVTHTTGTLTGITLAAGDYSIALSGLSVSASDTLKIAYDDRDILSIKVGNTSVLDKRTAASSDDLIAKVGQNTLCGVTANVAVKAKFTARGLWL